MSDPTRDELETSTGGRYQIEGFLAQGGMGMVYTARNRSLGSRVAIKVLPQAVAASDVRLARFKREAALAANLSHPNIVSVFEFDATPSMAYLVMPFVEGQTLSAQLADRGRLELAEVRQLISDVGKALAFAHKNGVIHRDIKPANLIQETATGRWMVMDFGVAHSQRTDDTEITKTGVVLGTPAYMPPEQAIGGKVDERTDLYSLAAVVVQALTGLGFDDLADCLTRDRTTIERVLKTAQPRLRPALVKALIWPLEKVPDDRPASADAWLSAIADAERTKSLYRWAWVATAAALAIAVFITLWPGEGPVAASTPTIAVAPFTGDLPASASELSVASLADALDWQLQYLPGHRLLRESFRQAIESRFGGARAETDSLVALARDRGATVLVEGRASSRGNRLSLEIFVQDIASQRTIPYDTEGPPDSLDALIEALVIEAFAEPYGRHRSGLKRALPRGLEAMSAFFQGMDDLYRGSYASAQERYEEVIRRDSTYALAHFYRTFALIFGARPSEYSVHLRSGLQAARAYRHGLDTLSQQLLDGYELLLQQGDLRGTEGVAQEILRTNPDFVDARFLLGFVQFNFGALIGRGPGEAQYQFRRATELDSSFAMAWWHLGEISTLLEENDRAEDALRRMLDLDSTSVWAEQAQVLVSVVFEGEIMTVLEQFRDMSIPALELISTSLAVLEPPEGTRTIMRAALDEFWQRSVSPYDLRLAFRMRMAALLAEGKWATAVEHLADGKRRRVPQDEIDRWIVLTAIISELPDLAPESEQLASARRLLDEETDRAEARWLAARWFLQGGSRDTAQAISELRAIVADPTTSSPHARSLLQDIEAYSWLDRGDSTRADSLWVEATRYYSVDDLIYGLTPSLWPLRLDRARLAAARGDHAAVVEIADSFMLLAGFTHQAVWPIVIRSGAESYAETGDQFRARELYRALEAILEDADGGGVERLNEVRAKRAASGN